MRTADETEAKREGVQFGKRPLECLNVVENLLRVRIPFADLGPEETQLLSFEQHDVLEVRLRALNPRREHGLLPHERPNQQ